MADIRTEIDTIGDLITPAASFTRLFKQTLPKEYVVNTVAIRWQGDTNESLTNVIYSVERTYQIVYFGNSEINCIQTADKIRAQLNNVIKAKLRGSDDYMTLELFNYSAPFKTETDGVYAIIGILPVTIYAARPQPKAPKMAVVGANVNGNYIETNENGGGN